MARLPNLVSIPKGYAPLNSQGMSLANLAAWHNQSIAKTGILAAYPENSSTQTMGSDANPIVSTHRPWVSEPPGSIPFDEQNAITLGGAPTPGVDLPVLTFTVPHGYDGVINYISNNATDPNFVDGSGDLIWKILINGRPVRNFENIVVQKGTLAQGRIISAIRLFSGDVVTYTVQDNSSGLPLLTGQVVCSLNGYFYPSRGIS